MVQLQPAKVSETHALLCNFLNVFLTPASCMHVLFQGPPSNVPAFSVLLYVRIASSGVFDFLLYAFSLVVLSVNCEQCTIYPEILAGN